mmetsp:Transcript_7128/g.23636  ORF Transcript_7128/g.23636 Transcript_7128/m.23636 type:complete len:287 (-) Transcript_7128:74-934(-)
MCCFGARRNVSGTGAARASVCCRCFRVACRNPSARLRPSSSAGLQNHLGIRKADPEVPSSPGAASPRASRSFSWSVWFAASDAKSCSCSEATFALAAPTCAVSFVTCTCSRSFSSLTLANRFRIAASSRSSAAFSSAASSERSAKTDLWEARAVIKAVLVLVSSADKRATSSFNFPSPDRRHSFISSATRRTAASGPRSCLRSGTKDSCTRSASSTDAPRRLMSSRSSRNVSCRLALVSCTASRRSTPSTWCQLTPSSRHRSSEYTSSGSCCRSPRHASSVNSWSA